MLNLPAEFKKGNKTYIYQERTNDYTVLYKEKNLGFYESFLIQDLVKIRNMKLKSRTPFYKGKDGKKEYEI